MQPLRWRFARTTSHPQHAAKAAARGANIYAVGVLLTDEDYARKEPLLERYAVEHRMAVLVANYSGESGGWKSAGKSALWSETGRMVAASRGTEEALIVGTRQNGEWSGEVVPLPAASASRR